MIDWWGVFANALWLVGLAVALAALSMATFRAGQAGHTLRAELAPPAFQVPLLAGLLLFCLGLLLASQSWAERLVWAALALLCGFVSIRGGLALARAGRQASPEAVPSPASAAGTAPDGSLPVTRNGRARPAVSRSRAGCLLLAAGLLLVAGWAAVTAAQLYGHGRSLLDHLQALEGLAAGDLASMDVAGLAGAGEHLGGMRRDLEAIATRLGPLPQAGRLLAWVPGYGGDLAAAPDLLDLALDVSAAGDGTFQALSPALDLLAGGSEGSLALLSAGEQVLPLLVEARPALEQARADLAAAQQVRAGIEAGSLSPRVAGLLARLDGTLPLFAAAVDGALLLPNLLGVDGPRTYLVMAQNNQELRATGGFISGVGELRVAGGRLESADTGGQGGLDLRDSYAVDNLAVPHEVAPADFQQVLMGDLIFFRDANWDPDFPTTARRALEIYARDQGIEADGVVALDLTALELLVAAAGSLSVAGVDGPVDARNVMRVIQGQWSQPAEGDGSDWWLHRKDFMGDVAAALFGKLAEAEGVEPAALVGALQRALDEKHLLVYLRDPAAAALLRARNWDGALPAPAFEGDFLMLVDTNAGFNKVDPRIQRSLSYQVDLASRERARARATATYRHRGQQAVGDCIQEARYGETYEDMQERCYWDYARLYVPEGSRLVEGPGLLAAPLGSLMARSSLSLPLEPALDAGDWAAWTAFFSLAPTEERTVAWTYDLPAYAIAARSDGLLEYRLRVAKQPGTDAIPLRLEIRLPNGAELVAGSLAVDTDLRQDRDFVVLYRPQPAGLETEGRP